MKIAKILYKMTGFTTKNYRMNLCTDVGKDLAKKYRYGKQITTQDVELCLKNNLSQKNFNNVISITKDKNVVREAALKDGMSEANIEAHLDKCQAAVLPLKKGKFIFYVSPEGINTKNCPGYVAHEMQHLFTHQTTFNSKINNLKEKFFPKSVEKFRNTYTDVVDEGYIKVYDKAVSMVRDQNYHKSSKDIQKEFSRLIKEEVLLPDNDKRNVKMLKNIELLIRDEARSYNINSRLETGDAQKAYEYMSKAMDNASKVLKQEKNNAIINRIKSLFRFKPKNMHTEVTLTKEDLLRMYKEGALNDSEIKFFMGDINFTSEELKSVGYPKV